MKLILLAFMLSLTACSTTVPVTLKFPDQPVELKESCNPLKPASSTQIAEFTKTVVENYEQ